MKVVLQDLVARVHGESEQELTSDQVIRFEYGDKYITCEMTSYGSLRIQKISKIGASGKLQIIPTIGNEIEVL